MSPPGHERGRVAVLGAGMAGLVAAYRLTQSGYRCDVYERWPGLGGQAATLDVGGGRRLERYYHHLFTSDRHIVALYDELGMGDELEWHPSSVAVFSGERLWPFTTPLDLLRFGPLPPLARIRMGLAVLALQRRRDVAEFEGETAASWVRREMGPAAWSEVWGPMLYGKFGDRSEDISMAWLWSKLSLRRQMKGDGARKELLGYPSASWEPLLDRLRLSIEQGGGQVLIDRPVQRLRRDGSRWRVIPAASGAFRHGHDPRHYPVAGDPEVYDGVVATVPSDVFAQLLDDDVAGALGPDFHRRLRAAEYHTALCLLLELDRSFSPFYWTNVADDQLPFLGLIEHTNLVDPARYDGRRFLYIANYLRPGDELLGLDADALLERYGPGLRRINPGFSREWIRQRWLFREPAAQPIVTVGYQLRIPPLETGLAGLVLANTTQIYPEDRGTNYSVRLGGDAAVAVQRSLGGTVSA